jgi:phytoene synthase
MKGPAAHRKWQRGQSDEEGMWDICASIARAHGRTFFLASRFLTPAQRRAILATYAFCRIADDIVDSAPTRSIHHTIEALARWEDELTHPRHPVAIAFAIARREFNIPLQPAHDLFTGIWMDLSATRFTSWQHLYTYAHHVAGTVGLMIAPILGCTDPGALPYAAQLGIAMQLTNILRDIREDAERGRLYLPLDEVSAFGCTPEEILAGCPGAGFRDLLAYQIQRARTLYANAAHGYRALSPSGRLTALAAARWYADILTEIERMNYAVFTKRASVSLRRKMLRAPGIFLSFLRFTLPAPSHSQTFSSGMLEYVPLPVQRWPEDDALTCPTRGR